MGHINKAKAFELSAGNVSVFGEFSEKLKNNKKAAALGTTPLALILSACGGGSSSTTSSNVLTLTKSADTYSASAVTGFTVADSSTAKFDVADASSNAYEIKLDATGTGVIEFDFADANDTVTLAAGSKTSGFTTLKVTDGTLDATNADLTGITRVEVASGIKISLAQIKEIPTVVANSATSEITVEVTTEAEATELVSLISAGTVKVFADTNPIKLVAAPTATVATETLEAKQTETTASVKPAAEAPADTSATDTTTDTDTSTGTDDTTTDTGTTTGGTTGGGGGGGTAPVIGGSPNTLPLTHAGSGNYTLGSDNGSITLTVEGSNLKATPIVGASASVAKANIADLKSDIAISGTAEVVNGFTMSGSGNVTITGSDGAQTLTVNSTGTNSVAGGAGNDTITVSAGTNTITGGSGVDALTGGSGADTFAYATSAEFIAATANADAVIDSVDGKAGSSDKVEIAGSISIGNAGADTLARVTNVEQLVAAANADGTDDLAHVIKFGSNALMSNFTTIDLSADLDTDSNTVIDLTGVTTHGLTVKGAAAATNTITGGAGNDTITGGSAANTITGAGGVDTITGGAANDTFKYATSADLMAATANADAVIDSVDGKGGSADKVEVTGSVSVGNAGSDTLARIVNVEQFVAASNADGSDNLAHVFKIGANAKLSNFTTIDFSADLDTDSDTTIDVTGVTTALTIKGAAAAINTITGGAGNDSITGGSAADQITGAAGVDTLTGAAGNDTYIYASNSDFLASNAVVDSITDSGGSADAVSVAGNIAVVVGDAFARAEGVEILKAATDSATARTHSVVINDDTKSNDIRTIDLSGSSNTSSSSTVTLTGVTNAFTVKGTGGADAITGTSAGDTLEGGAGNDTFKAASGDLVKTDTIKGEAGDDTIEITAADTTIEDADFANVTSVKTLALTGASTAVLGTNSNAGGIDTIDTGTGATDLTVTVAAAIAISSDVADDTAFALNGDDVNFTIADLIGDLTVNDSHTGDVGVTTGSVATLTVALGSNTTGTKSINASALTDGQALTMTGADAVGVTLVGGDLSAASYSGAMTVGSGAGSNVIATGTGNDKITITPEASVDVAVEATSGTDELVIVSASEVDLGAGSLTISLAEGDADQIATVNTFFGGAQTGLDNFDLSGANLKSDTSAVDYTGFTTATTSLVGSALTVDKLKAIADSSDLTGATLRGIEIVTYADGNVTATFDADNFTNVVTLTGGSGTDVAKFKDDSNITTVTNTNIQTLNLLNGVDLTIDAANLTNVTAITGTSGDDSETIILKEAAAFDMKSVTSMADISSINMANADAVATGVTLLMNGSNDFAGTLVGASGTAQTLTIKGNSGAANISGITNTNVETIALLTDDDDLTIDSANLTNVTAINGVSGNNAEFVIAAGASTFDFSAVTLTDITIKGTGADAQTIVGTDGATTIDLVSNGAADVISYTASTQYSSADTITNWSGGTDKISIDTATNSSATAVADSQIVVVADTSTDIASDDSQNLATGTSFDYAVEAFIVVGNNTAASTQAIYYYDGSKTHADAARTVGELVSDGDLFKLADVGLIDSAIAAGDFVLA